MYLVRKSSLKELKRKGSAWTIVGTNMKWPSLRIAKTWIKKNYGVLKVNMVIQLPSQISVIETDMKLIFNEAKLPNEDGGEDD